jgi:hypothetical protein
MAKLPPRLPYEPELRPAGDPRRDHIRREVYPCPACDGSGMTGVV